MANLSHLEISWWNNSQLVEGSEVPKINVLVNLVLQSKGVELTKLVDEPTNISFTIKLIWMQLSPVELVNLEKKFI